MQVGVCTETVNERLSKETLKGGRGGGGGSAKHAS